MILAAKYARENKVSYLGICLGMHISVVEISRPRWCSLAIGDYLRFWQFDNLLNVQRRGKQHPFCTIGSFSELKIRLQTMEQQAQLSDEMVLISHWRQTSLFPVITFGAPRLCVVASVCFRNSGTTLIQ
ncbi:hypothetical protein L1987_70089 [Smallanthus sonchifolius]|uniref:Uncharacterized protein n=1 Tax=Smallanthus sonchifolius TaxID=185202 RepID=A0ACB9ASX6_9ASTR|nr:hypothetical protein L1987_70089 [Smallanthus sonchifolius]